MKKSLALFAFLILVGNFPATAVTSTKYAYNCNVHILFRLNNVWVPIPAPNAEVDITVRNGTAVLGSARGVMDNNGRGTIFLPFLASPPSNVDVIIDARWVDLFSGQFYSRTITQVGHPLLTRNTFFISLW